MKMIMLFIVMGKVAYITMMYMRATRWLLELCLQRRKKAPRELK